MHIGITCFHLLMGNTGRRKKFGGKNGHFRIGHIVLYMHVKHLSIHKLYDYKCWMLCGKVSVATGEIRGLVRWQKTRMRGKSRPEPLLGFPWESQGRVEEAA